MRRRGLAVSGGEPRACAQGAGHREGPSVPNGGDSGVVLPPLVTPDDPRYGLERFDVRQAAAYLCVHVARIYSDAAAGQLAHRRDSQFRLRFAQADLDAWRQARRREVTPAVAPPMPRPPARAMSTLAVLPPPKKRRFA